MPIYLIISPNKLLNDFCSNLRLFIWIERTHCALTTSISHPQVPNHNVNKLISDLDKYNLHENIQFTNKQTEIDVWRGFELIWKQHRSLWSLWHLYWFRKNVAHIFNSFPTISFGCTASLIHCCDRIRAWRTNSSCRLVPGAWKVQSNRINARYLVFTDFEYLSFNWIILWPNIVFLRRFISTTLNFFLRFVAFSLWKSKWHDKNSS